MAAWEEWTAAAVAAAETYVIEPLAQTLHAAATPHLEKFPKFFFRYTHGRIPAPEVAGGPWAHCWARTLTGQHGSTRLRRSPGTSSP